MAQRAPTVVIDTNVFSADLLRSTRPLVELYRPILAARRFLICFQTLAELEFGLRRRSWGPARLERARESMYIELRSSGPGRLCCPRTSIFGLRANAPGTRSPNRITMPIDGSPPPRFTSVPLVSHDGIFRGAPNLAFETALDS